MAGGRISGPYAAAAGTTVKALVSVGGPTALQRVLDALRTVPEVGEVCVVGPEAIRSAVGDYGAWQPERDSALGNVEAGLERLRPPAEARILLCGSDIPAIAPAAVRDFLQRTPHEADICMPVVRKEAFEARFPGSGNVYVPLVEGHFTAGSLYVIRPDVVCRNLPLLRRLFEARKSQLGMTRILGAGFACRLLLRRLRVTDLEERASTLTGSRCRAVPDCLPELAFDIDRLPDVEYFERWLGASAAVP